MISTFHDDPDMADLLELFSRALPDRIAAIQAAYAASDFATLRRLAHQLKGAGAGYGFPPITHAADQLELAAGEGGARGELAAKIAELIAVCRAVESPARAQG